jgi:glucose-6-phosphate 1-dehydrogenase
MVPHRFIILGASGDLTGRYLLPALAELRESERLPGTLNVLGLARNEWDTAHFRKHATERLRQHASNVADTTRAAIVAGLEYRRADVTKAEEVIEAVGQGKDPAVFYLALPPALAKPALQALAGLPPPQGSRVVMEKPFGTDLASARELNRLVHDLFSEKMVFRMDHFLGHETVMNILGLRFANRILEPLWNREHIERVEITWDETLALEGRAGYYDKAGALRDMIQNHLLQVLCLVGMDPPLSFNERDLRDRKAELLRSVRKLSEDDIRHRTVRARYGAGRIGDGAVPAYTAERGVDASRMTETFAEVQLEIESWRWAGVPFVLRSGKALARSRREIAVYFRPVPHLVFGPELNAVANVLRIQLSPDRMSLLTNISNRRGRFELEPILLDTELSTAPLSAYARLLADILTGDVTLSIRDDEAEEGWRILQPVLDAWRKDQVPLLEYPAGSLGPERSLATPAD